MGLLQILHFPDPRLRNRAEAETVVDDAVRRLVDDMFATMYDAPGIGLAATQVNSRRRVITIDVSENRDAPLCLINPRIVEHDGSLEIEEGCLSVPGVYEVVPRAERIRVAALDREGRPFERDADGLLAVCIQHEMDHLEGRLFVDYLSQLKRQRIRKRALKQQRQPL